MKINNLILVQILFTIASIRVNAQIGPYDTAIPMPTRDLYDTDAMMMQLNTVREMSMRAARIRECVQPYREKQYQYYREGKYKEAVQLCHDVYRQYVYYAYDNRAISDMEILAGDCALRIGAYDSAIDWYQTVQRAEVGGMDAKLSHVFNAVMEVARNAYRSNNYNSLWNFVTIALKTGWESGECYYYYGVCYEKANNLKEAKKMYKKAKKKKYGPAATALQELKKK